MSKIDITVPRKMFWSHKVFNKMRCPFCKSKLENQYQTYMVAVRNKRDIESLIVGNNFGAFCPQCPVVVLDNEGFGETISQVTESIEIEMSREAEVAVMGIVNMEAIPEENRENYLAVDGEPLTVVEFVSTIEAKREGKSKRLSGNERRRRRKYQENDNK